MGRLITSVPVRKTQPVPVTGMEQGKPGPPPPKHSPRLPVPYAKIPTRFVTPILSPGGSLMVIYMTVPRIKGMVIPRVLLILVRFQTLQSGWMHQILQPFTICLPSIVWRPMEKMWEDGKIRVAITTTEKNHGPDTGPGLKQTVRMD